MRKSLKTQRRMLLVRLHRGEIIGRSTSAQMIEILKQTQSRNMIPRDLRRKTVVAHKTGGTWRVKADVGIVYTGNAPIVVAALTYSHPSERGAATRIDDASG